MDTKSVLEEEKQRFSVEIRELDEESVVFDLVGVDASFANALRRILLAEVPTMAIERVYFVQNSSILCDEIIAHRLGLIPILADPDRFQDKLEGDDPVPATTLVFRLHADCRDGERSVYSRELQWVPQGNQLDVFPAGSIRPIHENIVIVKLRAGQSLECEMHAERGIGKTHAKWSPVSTASYRLLPRVSVAKLSSSKDIEDLISLCPMKVFSKRKGELVVQNPRSCSMCRECQRNKDFGSHVSLSHVENHFIFSVESVGQLPAASLVERALVALERKCQTVGEEVQKLLL